MINLSDRNFDEQNGFYFDKDVSILDKNDRGFLTVNVNNHSSALYPICPESKHDLDEYVSFINSHKIKCVTVVMDDFTFLDKCHCIKRLNLYPSYQAPNHISFDAVYNMPNLEAVQPHTVYGFYENYWSVFDCAKLTSAKKLLWFGADCKKGIKNIGVLSHLKSLHLSSYKADDLNEVVNSSQLDTLDLTFCRIKTLRGIQHTKSLSALRIANCYTLENIDELYFSRNTLHGLMIDCCKRIKDFSVLESLTNLTRLSLIDSGNIPSLKFIQKMPKLKTLTLSTNVLDGRLDYCDNLEHFSVYPDKRHYNRKDKDFNKKSRECMTFGDEGIDEWRQNVLR